MSAFYCTLNTQYRIASYRIWLAQLYLIACVWFLWFHKFAEKLRIDWKWLWDHGVKLTSGSTLQWGMGRDCGKLGQVQITWPKKNAKYGPQHLVNVSKVCWVRFAVLSSGCLNRIYVEIVLLMSTLLTLKKSFQYLHFCGCCGQFRLV